MQATTTSVTLRGLDAHPVGVEVDSGRGIPTFRLVGLAQAAVKESRVRVSAALRQRGVDLNEWVITVNLAPAYLRKEGSGLDLPIAVAVLAALERIDAPALAETVLLGELSLNGDLRAVHGVLPSLMGARARGYQRAIVPRGNGNEAAALTGFDTRVAEHIDEVIDHLEGKRSLPNATSVSPPEQSASTFTVDLAEVRGQLAARRALEIAAAGSHTMLMVGPPGAGKTMLARRLPTIMPALDNEEALTITAIHSVAGLLGSDVGLLRERPFRAPHHSASAVALLGGGDPIRPGELSLAHHGVLFLDELLEFRRPALEGMRQPLEDGDVTICRAKGRATFPARPLLVAAVNPCPCGHHGSPRCRCTPQMIQRYQSRLSGPLIDRIDLQLRLAAVKLDELTTEEVGESSATVAARVALARQVQRQRFERGETSAPLNAQLTQADLDRVAPPTKASRLLLRCAVERTGLSARGYIKVWRVARSIADIEGSNIVSEAHFAEAVQSRALDFGAANNFAHAS